MKIKNIEFRTLELEAQYGRYSKQMGVLMAHTDEGPTGISRCLATARSVIEDRLAPMLVDRTHWRRSVYGRPCTGVSATSIPTGGKP